MSEAVYDGNGNRIGERTTGNTPKFYENGHLVGEIKDDGSVVNKDGVTVKNIGRH